MIINLILVQAMILCYNNFNNEEIRHKVGRFTEWNIKYTCLKLMKKEMN